MAAHDRARVRPGRRSDQGGRRPCPAGQGGGPGGDLRVVRGLRGRRAGGRGPARGAAGGGGSRSAHRRRPGPGDQGGPARLRQGGWCLMRLHRLRMTALGPYATEQMIDFDRLAQGGLFLLEGPTGAGKSTVLDAITFALYGGLAAEDSADDRLCSHFAAPDARTEAELEWSLRGVRYRVTRSPEYRRPKKRGDGMTTEPAHVHFQRRDGTAWVSVSANKAEAGEVISELLGLT